MTKIKLTKKEQKEGESLKIYEALGISKERNKQMFVACMMNILEHSDSITACFEKIVNDLKMTDPGELIWLGFSFHKILQGQVLNSEA